MPSMPEFLFREFAIESELSRIDRDELKPLFRDGKVKWQEKMRLTCKYGVLRCDLAAWKRGRAEPEDLIRQLDELKALVRAIGEKAEARRKR